MDMTLDVMGSQPDLLDRRSWSARGLMTRGGHIYAMTSSGGARVLPNYGPVSAAPTAALELQLASLPPSWGRAASTANSIRAPASPTRPRSQKIRGNRRRIMAQARGAAIPDGPPHHAPRDAGQARSVVLSHPDT